MMLIGSEVILMMQKPLEISYIEETEVMNSFKIFMKIILLQNFSRE